MIGSQQFANCGLFVLDELPKDFYLVLVKSHLGEGFDVALGDLK